MIKSIKWYIQTLQSFKQEDISIQNTDSNKQTHLIKEEMLRLAREYYEASMIVSKKCPNVAMNTMAYSIEVYNPADALGALMLVLAIDAEKCSRD